jgi:hypothetical protein
LLALARHAPTSDLPRVAQARTFELDVAIATVLEALATRAAGGVGQTTPELGGALDALDHAIPDNRGAPGEATATLRLGATLAIYRSLVATITRLSPVPLAPATAS